ncbi:MAG TPA: low molecular weight protein-tyrosine-phosphatase [Longimicrobiales bacterium]|nr:low molecular weight protein-tyrosine-phosphatase [Longimicrobiales bacterium]
MMEKIGVLFVCLGNICRSPLAEGVFRDVVTDAGLAERFDIDSAGTSDYHIGDSPDPRTMSEAKRRGLVLEHAARQLGTEDLERFDYVIAMDASNLGRIRRLAASVPRHAELHLLREFDPESRDDLEVPDPYFGGPDGFADVHDMVERACRGLLDHIRDQSAP